MNKLLADPWITAPVGVVMYLAATVLFWQNPDLPRLSAKLAAVVHGAGPSWDFKNPEADLLVSELKMEKKALDLRQQQLDDLAARLQAERAELGQVTQTVRQLQSEFDKSVIRVKEEETGNLKKLAKVYADMSPETAADVLSQLDNEAIVKILLYVKEEQTAAILEALAKKGQSNSRRTAEISEQLRLSAHNTPTK